MLSLLHVAAKEYMLSVAADIVKKRRENPDKEEHLFVDCVIDADFLSPQEVCLPSLFFFWL